MQTLLPNLFLFEDTCNVYVIRSGRDGVLIDFGSGDVLQHLNDIGVERVTDVLITHHHRDQCQGLQRAADAGIRIWVPHTEQDLFQQIDAHWQSREIFNNYNMRLDRFSLLESVPVTGTLHDYEEKECAGIRFTVLATPGHTTGSVSLKAEIDETTVAFTGDLISAPGKTWSLATTQWSYNGAEGVAASILSLLSLKDDHPEVLLPSHGNPMTEPDEAIDLLVERFAQLLKLRNHYKLLFDWHENPFTEVTPHLLRNRTSMANSYVLLSQSGKALLIDYGYDFYVGAASGSDRASRRPWLYSLPKLKQQYGVTSIDVVVPTHFHDDHVAGLNLLRSVEGTKVWAAESFADILEHPAHYDLPCLWYDPIPVDRCIPHGIPVQWEEYTLTLYPLPGHTLYAVAIYVEVDGKRVLATGDQYQGNDGLEPNYVYLNRFRAGDYVQSADLFERLNPDVIISGHWFPLWVEPGYFDKLHEMGAELEQLHHELLPQSPVIGEEGFIARMSPYQTTAKGGEEIDFQVDVRNPFDHPAEALVKIIVPPTWKVIDSQIPGILNGATDGTLSLGLNAFSTQPVTFRVVPPEGFAARRTRVAVDVEIDGQRFGQQAEALVSKG